jgi:hypothetical protein
MTTEPTEALLRESLQAHVDDVGSSTADPWLRVSRAHRRSRLRRRTAAVGALAAVAAVTGSLAGIQPWDDLAHNAQPAENDGSESGWVPLDDGVPRGALGSDPALIQAVLVDLQKYPPFPNSTRPKGPEAFHVLWGGVLEQRRLALVQLPDDEAMAWFVGPADGGSVSRLTLDNSGLPITALPYLGPDGERRLLAVVGRDATVTGTRTAISADRGRVQRHWSPVEVKDGVVDVPVPDALGQGPLLLRAQYPSGKDGYASSVNPFSPSTDSAAPNGLTVEARQAMAAQARGPGLAWHLTGEALDSAMIQLWSDAAHTDPRLEWAGTVPAERGGGSLVVASAGFPGQGRILTIRRDSPDQQDLWRYVGTVPAGTPSDPGSALALRLTPSKTSDDAAAARDQQIVVWMFGSDTSSVSVKVNGKTRSSTTQDGLGWLLVKPDDQVSVTGHRSTGGDAQVRLDPKDVEPPTPDWPLFGRK